MKEIRIDQLIIFLFCLLTSCGTRTVYVPVDRVHTETVTLKDTIVDIRLEHIHDSVSVSDSVSYLTNKYAYSWAGITGGRLNHSLGTWPVNIPVEIKYIDRIITDSIPFPYEVKVIEYKDKPLTWWQRVRITAGDISLWALAGAIIFLLVKLFLKKKLTG
jgi:hypothetical protein